MTYPQTLDYLYNKLPMFSRMGSAAYKKDLTNTVALCEALGNPHQTFKTVHVAGTNGKGSVSHMLASVLQAAGYKTGLYTSPHLYDFRERIRRNGEMIPEEYVTRFVEGTMQLVQNIQPSFFELTVAMAFQYFAEQQVDIAVIEVGLGGRLDSTNVITPELSVITNIGFDHTAILGNTLQEIAFEKAGIIKTGVPVVVGETVPETKAVFEQVAKKQAAPLIFAEDQYVVRRVLLEVKGLMVEYKKPNGTNRVFGTDLAGLYQQANIRTVLTAIDELRTMGWQVNDGHIYRGLSSVKASTGLQGRWEVIATKPTIVLDVAHNGDGIAKMLEHVRQLSFRRLHLVLGFVKDKDVSAVLRPLPDDAVYYFTQAAIPRALPAADLAKDAREFSLVGDVYPNVNDALTAAKSRAKSDDLIVVCGSIFLVAEVDRSRFGNGD